MVDTNVIAYLFLEGQRTLEAERLLEIDSDWVAPLLWRSEFCSVLAVYLRQGIISLGVGVQLIEEARHLMQGNEFEVSPAHVLKLSAQSQCSTYDCEFVSLAQTLNIPLITSDKRILREFPATATSIESFTT